VRWNRDPGARPQEATLMSSTARAYGFASTPSPKELAAILGGEALRVTKTFVMAKPAAGQWIVGYDFGALVFVGVPEGQCKATLERVLSKIGPEPHPPIEESLPIEVKEGAPVEVRFDRVLVPALTDAVVEVLTLALAQSVGMEYYEEDVDALVTRVRRATDALAETGRQKGSVREMRRFIGSGMSTRNQVIFTLALLDTPQLAWDDETVDKLYRGLRTLFEIEDRYRALDHKLTIVQDTFELLSDLTQERRSWYLEILVAALVGAEVLLFIYQLVHEFRHPG
jgi:required for meiotic nuclear division protein 1